MPSSLVTIRVVGAEGDVDGGCEHGAGEVRQYVRPGSSKVLVRIETVVRSQSSGGQPRVAVARKQPSTLLIRKMGSAAAWLVRPV